MFGKSSPISGYHESLSRNSLLGYFKSDNINASDKVSTLKNLSQLGENAAIMYDYMDVVAGLLRDEDKEVQVAALQVMQGAGGAATAYVGQVVDLTREKDADVSYEALATLSSMGPVISGEGMTIVEKLGAESVKVRYAAVLALAATEDTTYVEKIAALLQDNSPDVQGAACVALGSLGAVDKAESIAKKLDAPRSRPYALGALEALENYTPGAAAPFVEAICKCASDADLQTQVAASKLIGKMPDKVQNSVAAYGYLQGLLTHDDGSMRIAGACAIAQLAENAEAESVALLMDMLTDNYEDMVTNSLAAGGAAPRVPAFLRKAKCAALMALGRLGKKSEVAVDSMAKLLSSDDYEARLCACAALGDLGAIASEMGPKVSGCLSDSKYIVRMQAVYALGRFGDSDAILDILDKLEDSAPSVRERACYALVDIGMDAEVHADKVAALLNSDHSAQVHAAAITALGKMGTKGSFFAAAIAPFVNGEGLDPAIRVAAITALGQMKERGSAFVDEVNWAMQDESPEIRFAAAESLASLGMGGGGYNAIGY